MIDVDLQTKFKPSRMLPEDLIMQFLEAVARLARNKLRTDYLDASVAGPPAINTLAPRQLRRISGNLADFINIIREPGRLGVILAITQRYAVYHQETWKIFVDENQVEITAMLDEMISNHVRRL